MFMQHPAGLMWFAPILLAGWEGMKQLSKRIKMIKIGDCMGDRYRDPFRH